MAFFTICCAVGLELGLEVFAERDGLGGDDVHERAALAAGEDAAVDRLGQLFVVGQDQPAARAAEGLVRRRGDDVGVRERRRMHARRRPGRRCARCPPSAAPDFIGDLAELGEVDGARIGAVAAEDHLGLQFLRLGADGIEIDRLGLRDRARNGSACRRSPRC